MVNLLLITAALFVSEMSHNYRGVVVMLVCGLLTTTTTQINSEGISATAVTELSA